MRYEKQENGMIKVTELVEQSKEATVEQVEEHLNLLEGELESLKAEKERLSSEMRELIIKEDELMDRIEPVRNVLGIEGNVEIEKKEEPIELDDEDQEDTLEEDTPEQEEVQE